MIVFSFLFLFVSQSLFAQGTIDSLKKIMQYRNNDTVTLNTLNQIAEIYSDDNFDSAMVYVNKSIPLAKSLINSISKNNNEFLSSVSSQLAKSYSIAGAM